MLFSDLNLNLHIDRLSMLLLKKAGFELGLAEQKSLTSYTNHIVLIPLYSQMVLLKLRTKNVLGFQLNKCYINTFFKVYPVKVNHIFLFLFFCRALLMFLHIQKHSIITDAFTQPLQHVAQNYGSMGTSLEESQQTTLFIVSRTWTSVPAQVSHPTVTLMTLKLSALASFHWHHLPLQA